MSTRNFVVWYKKRDLRWWIILRMLSWCMANIRWTDYFTFFTGIKFNMTSLVSPEFILRKSIQNTLIWLAKFVHYFCLVGIRARKCSGSFAIFMIVHLTTFIRPLKENPGLMYQLVFYMPLVAVLKYVIT